MRPIPRTLSGQLTLIILAAVIVTLVVGGGIHLRERMQALTTIGVQHTAQRLAQVVAFLEPLSAGERQRLLPMLASRRLDVALARTPQESPEGEGDPRTLLLRHFISAQLGEERALRVALLTPEEAARLPKPEMRHPGMGRMGPHRHRMPGMMSGPPGGGNGAAALTFRIQVRLDDGSWAVFHQQLPEALLDWPPGLLGALLALLVVVAGLSWWGVQLATRPLARLAEAARGLGRDLHHPPLPEAGPREVRRAAAAFNAMQGDIRRHVDARTRMLAAVSHDLRTPITRMRLRAELLPEGAAREGLLADLAEMAAMTTGALEFLRGAGRGEPRRPLDLAALLETVAEEFDQLGAPVAVACAGRITFPLMPQAIKRCLTNLVQNGVSYAKEVGISARLDGDALVLEVADRGPGIPEGERERLLEPFERLEPSRSRHTGGSGLGLAIAREIARAHDGDLTLANRPGGGLLVTITLPPAESGV